MNRCSPSGRLSQPSTTLPAAALRSSRSARFARLLLILVPLSLLWGCIIVLVTGPTQVAIGEIVTYRLDLANGDFGASGADLLVFADVPDTWALISASWEGVIQGAETSGLGVVVPDPGRCQHPLPVGYQRYAISAGTFNVGPDDTGRADLTFQVNGLPDGPFPLLFRFLADPLGSCSNLVGLTINRGRGFMQYLGSVVDGIDGVFALEQATGAAVSPDGANVYVAGGCGRALQACPGGLAAFARDPSTGGLTFTQGFLDGQDGVNGLERGDRILVTPDGRQVYAAGVIDPLVAAFSRDPATGLLTFFAGVAGAPGSHGGLATSPDGNRLFIAGDKRLDAYDRDPVTGNLTLFDSATSAGPTPFIFLRDVAISPDGRHLYVADEADMLYVFNIDPITGFMTFSNRLVDNNLGIDGLDGAFSVAVSPDGEQVYVASQVDDALAVFDRNPDNGFLAFVEAVRNGEKGIGLDGAKGVAVSSDSRLVFVGASWGLTVLARDIGTSELRHVETLFNGDFPALGLFAFPAVDPSDRNLYLPAGFDGAILSFSIGDPLFSDGFESGDIAAWTSGVP